MIETVFRSGAKIAKTSMFRVGGDPPATHKNALQRDRKPVDE